MAGDIEHLRESVEHLIKTWESFTKTYHDNNTKIMTGLNSSERWQEAHERLDDERWRNFDGKLSEVKGLLESVPVKLASDLHRLENDIEEVRKENRDGRKALWERVNDHDGFLKKAMGAWVAISVLGAVLEFYLHTKGG